MVVQRLSRGDLGSALVRGDSLGCVDRFTSPRIAPREVTRSHYRKTPPHRVLLSVLIHATVAGDLYGGIVGGRANFDGNCRDRFLLGFELGLKKSTRVRPAQHGPISIEQLRCSRLGVSDPPNHLGHDGMQYGDHHVYNSSQVHELGTRATQKPLIYS